MSMEALEMMVKHAKNLLFCRPAKSGEDIYAYIRGRPYYMLRPAPIMCNLILPAI